MNRKIQHCVLILSLTWLGAIAAAHDAHHHHEEMKAAPAAISGESLFNLKSEWKNIDGKSATLSSLAGRTRLIAMLYTSCSTACPMIVEDMKNLRAKMPEKARGKLDLAVLSFDPVRDTPENLRKFAQKRNLDLRTWTLLSPLKESSATELAAALGVQFKKVKDDYVHSNIIFLVNEKGEVIASKEGLASASPDFEQKIANQLK